MYIYIYMYSSVYEWRVDRLQDKTIRNDHQAEFGVHTNDFFQTLGDLHREGITGEEVVHRMPSKWESGR